MCSAAANTKLLLPEQHVEEFCIGLIIKKLFKQIANPWTTIIFDGFCPFEIEHALQINKQNCELFILNFAVLQGSQSLWSRCIDEDWPTPLCGRHSNGPAILPPPQPTDFSHHEWGGVYYYFLTCQSILPIPCLDHA